MHLTGGNIHDSVEAEVALKDVPLARSVVLADKAYGAKAIRDLIRDSGATYCIPPKSNEKHPWDCDWWMYKERHLVECFFQKLKQYRGIATRYCKLTKRFLSLIHLASIMIWLA